MRTVSSTTILKRSTLANAQKRHQRVAQGSALIAIGLACLPIGIRPLVGERDRYRRHN